ncbi:MAG: hypothetical protein FWG87_13275 [Defluviitaleaceae bacterium]|nr:hypothetical protein [Defluviitaleaceae bacterium]
MIGRYPSRIDERAYLGTDKSVPYNTPRAILVGVRCCFRRGRIYPPRGYHALN